MFASFYTDTSKREVLDLLREEGNLLLGIYYACLFSVPLWMAVFGLADLVIQVMF